MTPLKVSASEDKKLLDIPEIHAAQDTNSMYNMEPVNAPAPSSVSSDIRFNFQTKSDQGLNVRSALPKTMREQDEHISIRIDVPRPMIDEKSPGVSNDSSSYIKIDNILNQKSKSKGTQMLELALSAMKSASASILQQEYTKTAKSQDLEFDKSERRESSKVTPQQKKNKSFDIDPKPLKPRNQDLSNLDSPYISQKHRFLSIPAPERS